MQVGMLSIMLVVVQAMRAHGSCYHGVFLCLDAGVRRTYYVAYLTSFCDCLPVEH